MAINNVDKWIELFSERKKEEITEKLVYCKSPIEKLFCAAFMSLSNTIDIPFLLEMIDIEPQSVIMCGDKKYIVDFLIPVYYGFTESKFYVVECDGFDYHYANKDQVNRDNERTRNLQKYGYTVIRFSGSELNKNPIKCAYTVKDIIQKPAIEHIKRSL